MLLTVVAWLAVSNHCALAATVFSLRPEAAPICNSCHDEDGSQSQPSSKPDATQSGEIACCKVLKATASDLKTISVAQQLPVGSIDYAIVAEFDFPIPAILFATAMPTGPPQVRSFAELVLNRSLPAHAPPFLVA
ncbi:MAG TPA: hypothetical protein VIT21_09510 [Chthoniobacterales bacterium]